MALSVKIYVFPAQVYQATDSYRMSSELGRRLITKQIENARLHVI